MCFCSVAAYTFTAIDTRPKEIAPFQIDLMPIPRYQSVERVF
jgi:hypothetical protein